MKICQESRSEIGGIKLRTRRCSRVHEKSETSANSWRSGDYDGRIARNYTPGADMKKEQELRGVLPHTRHGSTTPANHGSESINYQRRMIQQCIADLGISSDRVRTIGMSDTEDEHAAGSLSSPIVSRRFRVLAVPVPDRLCRRHEHAAHLVKQAATAGTFVL